MLRILIGLAVLAAQPVAAQTEVPPPPAADAVAALQVVPVPATVLVALQTSEGVIRIAVEVERAPVTAANFLRYVDQKRLDGTKFYRAMRVENYPDWGLIQGGVRGDPKRSLPPIKHEPTTKTGLSHVEGAVSMARAAPGTAAGDFFISIGALTPLDANPAQPGDNAGYAVFGRVVDGMDVVKRIQAAPVSATEGQGAMKGQILAAPVAILAARRVKP